MSHDGSVSINIVQSLHKSELVFGVHHTHKHTLDFSVL